MEAYELKPYAGIDHHMDNRYISPMLKGIVSLKKIPHTTRMLMIIMKNYI